MSDSHEADAAAMMRLRDGDDLALNELMARWQQPLANYLARLCGNEATALDLAQETFVRIYEARARYDTRGKFATWLYTIAGNLARNAHRWQQRHPTVSLDAPTDTDGGTVATHLPDGASQPDASAERGERAAAVRTAISELPEDQRAIVLMSEYEDRPHADIAAVLGCTAKAVETRLYRARQTLRERLLCWLN
ncbi:MAG: sigma-70 family RNA polymerase sigma factor [Chthoniobacteraceae bacterium]